MGISIFFSKKRKIKKDEIDKLEEAFKISFVEKNGLIERFTVTLKDEIQKYKYFFEDESYTIDDGDQVEEITEQVARNLKMKIFLDDTDEVFTPSEFREFIEAKNNSGAKKESLENYLQTAAAIQDGLNKMISECKMKGADHEALHHWLEPLMDKTKELKNANSIETARTISGEIEKQINLFLQYFE